VAVFVSDPLFQRFDLEMASFRWARMARRSALVFSAMALLLFSLEARFAAAQEDGSAPAPGGATAAKEPVPEPPPPRVKLGEIAATPGSSVMVPVYFTPDPKTAIRSFTVEVQHVSNNLEFQSAVDGAIEGLEITSSVTKGTPDEKGVTRSKFRVTVTDKKSKGLPDGLVSFLMFNLSQDAKPFVIKLNTKAVSAEGQSAAQKVSNLNVVSGSVTVESSDVEPGMTCFFFSH